MQVTLEAYTSAEAQIIAGALVALAEERERAEQESVEKYRSKLGLPAEEPLEFNPEPVQQPAVEEKRAKKRKAVEAAASAEPPATNPAPSTEPPASHSEVAALEQKHTELAQELTLEAVRAKLAAISQAGKQAQVKALLADYGVAKLTDLPQDKYADILEKAEAIT